ncbi:MULTISPECIES: hypothetical protein [unclassified Prochlorococcus]|nr:MULTISPECIES: hypothetical protein [unclassified Prochlorococcus]
MSNASAASTAINKHFMNNNDLPFLAASCGCVRFERWFVLLVSRMHL